MRWIPVLLLCALVEPVYAQPRPAEQARPAERMAFWNLTSSTVTYLAMAPAGTDKFGPDQCVNDRDKEVDHDERLRLTGIAPGRYDVRVSNKAVSMCTVRNVEVKSGGKFSFSLEDKDLTGCE